MEKSYLLWEEWKSELKMDSELVKHVVQANTKCIKVITYKKCKSNYGNSDYADE